MHFPVSAPVHGMPWISGTLLTSPGEEKVTSLGVSGGTAGEHSPLAGSTVSSGAHAVIVGVDMLLVGTAKTASAGAAAITAANPPARIRRRAGFRKVDIVTLFL
jgi:hypothetical protein